MPVPPLVHLLLVVLLAMDVLAEAVQIVLHVGALPTGDLAILLRLRPLYGDGRLLIWQALRLLRREVPVPDAPLDWVPLLPRALGNVGGGRGQHAGRHECGDDGQDESLHGSPPSRVSA